jgi:guanylate kinase
VQPILFIVTGPSGAGKGSVMRALLERDSHLSKVVTYTTRPPRKGEIDGFDYRFISLDDFHAMIQDGRVFEHEQVYQDYYYGSPRELFVEGRDGLIELDYKGRVKYQARHDQVVSIFLLPPDLDELKRRILARSEVSNLDARLANAIEQMRHAHSYDYVVKNDDFDDCVTRVETIIQAERIRRQGQFHLKTMDAQMDLSDRHQSG